MSQRSEPRLSQEASVRIFGMDSGGRPINLASSTIDISRSGARLKGVKCWDFPGEIIGVRHGTEKARFRVVWVGSKGSPIEGQVGLQCVEFGRYIFGVMAPSTETRPDPAALQMRRTGAHQLALHVPQSATSERRRREQRFNTSGGVNVREIGPNSVPQWTMLHDISIGGCYVETTSPLPPLSRVEMTLQAGELKIECKGSVTVKHPLVGMGIKFTDMSPLNRERLQHLISSLEEQEAQASANPY